MRLNQTPYRYNQFQIGINWINILKDVNNYSLEPIEDE